MNDITINLEWWITSTSSGVLFGYSHKSEIVVTNSFVNGSSNTEGSYILGHVKTNVSLDSVIEYTFNGKNSAIIDYGFWDLNYTKHNLTLMLNITLNGDDSAGIMFSDEFANYYVNLMYVSGIIRKC